MGPASPSSQSSLGRKDVRRMLAVFAVLAVAGVLLFAVSRILGLLVLVAAEVFFVIAYRRFSKISKGEG
jgi:hypothetical protein